MITEVEINTNSIRYCIPMEKSGVYILYSGDTPVYVGQSSNVVTRVAQHASEGSKEFDSYKVIPAEKDNLFEVERILIFQLNPKYNSKVEGFVAIRALTSKIEDILGKKIGIKSVRKVISDLGIKEFKLHGKRLYNASDSLRIAKEF